MAVKKFKNMHDGQRGAAVGVRIVPRAAQNKIVEILNDGTVKIRLTAAPDSPDLNTELLEFLSSILDVSADAMDIVAGIDSLSKLISILNIDSETCQQKILRNIQ